ncbi:Nmad5 family putative nucleotide modification protein [Hymenobacter fodinae]|uniref:Nucleotide modification associated domain-containing protein n=1 Tax=Hymenobacter fodinae TaxID=2510796 RepID=A0A4Z0P1E4_9BACT|nr:Nmad5 family putative nucleotide modification protein [Hymenobacter fodinae]TGE04602.1 hypothetical protein EU556_20675 [Hymenobacter fodinae]
MTNEIRDNIARNATKQKFTKENDAIKQEENDLALELYHSLFTPEELKLVTKLDTKWFHQDKCLRFNCGGYNLMLCIKEGVPVPYSRHCSILGNISGDLAIKAQEFANKKKDVEADQAKALRAIGSVLYSVNTIKQLKTVWPEGADFYAMYDEASAKSKGGVPAVQIDEINKLLGLGGAE